MLPDRSGHHRQDLLGTFARHKVAANLLMGLMLMAGVVGLIKLNTQFLPTFGLDLITVRVIWPGAGAEDVARSVTTPLEQELKGLDFVKKMTSTSSRNSSVVVLEFEEGTNMSIALDNVKDRVSTVRNLPSDAEEPQISKVTRYEDVATLILTSEASLEELRPLAYQWENELMQAGIARIDFVGLPEQEIAIQVPASRLLALQQSLPQLGDRIIARSQDIPAGTTGRNEGERELRGLLQQRTAEGFRRIAVLTTADGQQLRLGDIAEVERRYQDNSVELFYQGQPAVMMRLQRTETADTLRNAEILNNWLDQTRPGLLPTVGLHVFNEPYVLIQERIDLLITNGLGGLILVISILFIFLNARVAFWVAVGIPVSFAGTLAVMMLVGGSINMVSMFALIMALGIIVDDAIVVGEDALTHFERGEGALEAAEGGARRMLVPVLSSSLTTIAAFLPLLIISGIIGQILVAIPIVIICVIIASLIESFLILPGHLRHSLQKMRGKPVSPMRRKIERGFAHFRDHHFRPLAEFSLDNRALVISVTVACFMVAIAMVASGRVSFTFFPTPEGTFLNASVKFAAGTPESKVREFAFRMENTLLEVDRQLREDAPSVIAHSLVRLNTGSFDGGINFQQGTQYATVQVELTSPDKREVRNSMLVNAWEKALPDVDGLEQISIASPKGGPPGADVDVFLKDAPIDELKKASEALQAVLRDYEGINNLQDDLPYGRQQYLFDLKPEAEALGLSINELGRQLRAGFDGRLLQVFNEGQDEIEVRIVLPDAERDARNSLAGFPIITPDGSAVPLANLVTLESRRGLELLRHTNGIPGIHVTAEVDPEVSNGNQVLAALAESTLPELVQRFGLSYSLEGRAEEQNETFADMQLGAIIGLILMYVVLAWVFSSYWWPIAVMATIPFGLTGAILGHSLMGLDLTILSLFGFFGLSGIVVNDSIILVTFYKQLREQGLTRRDALVEAACQRLRAVLLTSLTTIAGLLPLLFETSLQAQFLIPMAVSISFGLAFATLLVLLVIPCILSLLEGLAERLSGEAASSQSIDPVQGGSRL